MYLRLKEPQRHRAILIDAHDEREALLDGLLLDRGIVVIARFCTLTEALTVRQLPECDLVIVHVGGQIPEAEASLSTATAKLARPVLLITSSDDPDRIGTAIAHGADAVLCVGAAVDRLRAACVSAIAHFERAEGLRQRAERAERDLEARKLVERAKGILMQQRGIAEPEAYRELQRVSMTRNAPLAEIAQSVIAAKELLG